MTDVPDARPYAARAGFPLDPLRRRCFLAGFARLGQTGNRTAPGVSNLGSRRGLW